MTRLAIEIPSDKWMEPLGSGLKHSDVPAAILVTYDTSVALRVFPIATT